MAIKRVKLAILRARHDTSVPFITDAACIALFMTNASRQSILNYWETVTDSYLQFEGSSLMPWVDITLGTDTTRGTQVAKAYAAASALPGAVMDGFDGFVVLTHPGTVTMPNPQAGMPGQPPTITVGIDGGAGPIAGGKPAVALPVMPNNHTFFCHEVGHVLGFKHTYGVLNNGVDWDGIAPFDQAQVYGDPYDIMSSATFGTRNLDPALPQYRGNPTFVGAPVVGWPNPGALTMGPEPARAHVHLWDPQAFPAGRVFHVAAPLGRGVRRQRLVAAGRHGGGVNLLVVHPANEDPEGRGRCYVEYRQRIGWDDGLDLSGADLARQAVVVHTLANATGDGVRCWYRGRILIPLELDTDVAVEGTQFVVRVSDVEADGSAVEVEVSVVTPSREISIETRNYESLLAEHDVKVMGTPCGDTIVSATRTWQTTSYYRAATRGFGGLGKPDVASPVLTWTVDGKPVTVGGGFVDVETTEGVFTVQYELDGTTAELVLWGHGGQRYTTEVAVRATEQGGGNSVTETRSYSPVGFTEGFTGADLAKLDRCMVTKFQEVSVRPRDWIVPPDPNPLRRRLRDRLNEARLRVIVGVVGLRHPAQARELRQMVDMRFQGPPMG